MIYTYGPRRRVIILGSYQLFFRLQIGAGVCAFFTADPVATGEVNKSIVLTHISHRGICLGWFCMADHILSEQPWLTRMN